MTLEELQVLITAKTSGLQAEIKNVSKQLKGLENSTQKTTKAMQKSFEKSTSGIAAAAKKLKVTLAALGIGKVLKDSFNMARTYEASLGQVNRLLGQNSKAFQQWVDKNALTFGLAKSQAMEYASIYGNLLSGFMPDTTSLTFYTQELLKASSIIATNTGRTIEDVNQRLRSGLLGNTEAIEDLGVNVNVALLETTEAFKQLSNGKSWNKLSFQTQQQIRLMAILEQTSKKFGDSIQNNTNYQLMILTAQLKDVALNLGNAFKPIIDAVLPILNSFAAGLAKVTNTLAIFMNALFGTSTKQIVSDTQSAASGLGNVASGYEDAGNEAEKAGKKAKNALASFDEVNTLNFGSDSGSGGAGGSLGSIGNVSIDTSELEASEGLISDKMQSIIDSIKETLQPFLEIDLGPLTESFNKLKEALAPITDALFAGLKWGIDNVIFPLTQWTIEKALPEFFNLLSAALGVLNPLIQALQPLGEWLWNNFLKPLATWTGAVIIAALQGLTKALQSIGKWMSENQSVVTGITVAISGFFAAWKVTQLLAFIQMSGGVVGALTAMTTAIKAGIAAKIADKAETIALTLMYAKDFVVSLGASVVALAKQTAAFVANKVAVVASTVSQVAMTAATVVWNGVCATGTAVTSAFGVAMGILTSPITLVIGSIAALTAGIVLLVKNWDTVKDVSSRTWESIKSVWNNVGNWFTDNVVEPIRKAFDGLFGGISKTITGIKKGIGNIFSRSINLEDIDMQTTMSMATVPKLARGGIVDGATFMGNYIAGEAGKEMIVPLENTPFVDKLASALGAAVMNAMQFNNVGATSDDGAPVVFELDGSEFARAIIPGLRKEVKRTGVSLG